MTHRTWIHRGAPFVALAALLLALAGPAGSTLTPAASAAPIDPQVSAALAAAPDGQAPFLVYLRDPAAGATTPAELGRAAGQAPDWAGRGRAVADRLRAAAQASQAGILDRLARGRVPGRVSSYQAFWIANVIAVTGDRQAAEWLAGQPAVAAILPELKLDPPEPVAAAAAAPTAPTYGVHMINADDVWSVYGVRGEGTVIGMVDTGVQWDHPALKPHYRGWDGISANHNYNWWDPAHFCGAAGAAPCDNNGHGTHTTGTAAGGVNTTLIGVAPGAQWIHAAGCCASNASLLSSLQWMLAPTDLLGNNPDPAKRPQVINNSWGGPGGSLIFDDALAALRAAGIVPVFSAGNDGGQGCGTVGSPGDNLTAFNVGATDAADGIAYFSARGANPFDGLTDPDVTAPGASVLSSAPGGGYNFLSGTSMAAPHVAGAVALILSAEPDLAGQVDQIEELLRKTAQPLTAAGQTCGGVPGTQIPNNTYGWGRIDVKAAVDLVWRAGTLRGTVTSAGGGPLAGAIVAITRNGDTLTQKTAADGSYSFVAGAGTYQVGAGAAGYVVTPTSSVNVSQDTATTQDFALDALETGGVSGKVTMSGNGSPGGGSRPVSGATVTLTGTTFSAVTAADGAYTLANVPFGAYTARMTSPGFETLSAAVTVSGPTTLNFAPAAVPDYVVGDGGDACSAPYAWVDATGGAAYKLADDSSVSVALPWPFTFYGKSYSTLHISSNGFVSFGQGYSKWHGIVPYEGPPNNQIIGLGEDLNPENGTQGVIYTKNLGDGRFVIEYHQVQHWASGNPETFEIILNRNDGTIVVQYQAVSWPDFANAGIENADGSRGILYSYANQPPLAAGLAVKYTPFSGQPPACAPLDKVVYLPLVMREAAGPAQPAEFHLRVTTPAYVQDAQGVRVAGYATNDAPGAPALPVWRTMVELPATGEWRLTYTSAGERILPAPAALPAAPVPQLDLAGPAPAVAQPDLPARARLINRPDPAIYAADARYPAAPVAAAEQWQRGHRLLAVTAFPFQYNPVRGELSYHPDLSITIAMVEAGGTAGTEETARINRASLSEGERRIHSEEALRISTDRRGMYRLTYSDLAAASVPVANVNPAALAMWYGDAPIAIEVTGAADGRFDPGDLVIFYAEPYTGRYMTQNVYWLTWVGAAGARVAARDATPAAIVAPASTITQTLRVEYDRVYYSEYLLPSSHDHFFDNSLYVMQPPGTSAISTTYPFPLDDPVAAGRVRLRAAFYGGRTQAVDPDQSVAIAVNGQAAGVYQWKGSVLHAITDTLPAAWLTTTQITNQVTLTAALDQLPGLTSYWVVPDWVELSYPARADAEQDRLYIEGVDVNAGRPPHRVYLPLVFGGTGTTPTPGYQVAATGFTTADVRIYDVRDPRQPVRLTGARATSAGPTFTVQFSDPQAATGSYYLAAEAGLLAPAGIVHDTPSAWRAAGNTADYIAIVHRALWDAIQPLLDHRAAEGLRVAKVDVQDIYDEWSGGRVDPEAIRSFLAYTYQNWNAGGPPPAYVLLVGDGHYDFKNVRGTNLPNLIPPYLLNLDPWIGETAADNRFVSVDGPGDYLPDMAIGRIPAKTPAEVAAVVSKILAYENTAASGPWQSRAIFVADDYANSAGNFHALSDEVRLNDVPAGYETPRLYYRLDTTLDTAAEMRTAIRGAFNGGALLIQWFGHASRARWGSVDMFNTTDVPALAANTTWPLTANYACWSGYFINMSTSGGYGSVQTLAEQLLLTTGRGALADFSPSGLHIGGALLTLDRGLTRAIFQDRQPRVGLAANAAKLYFYANSASWHDIIDTQILFGDPATRLRLPPITR